MQQTLLGTAQRRTQLLEDSQPGTSLPSTPLPPSSPPLSAFAFHAQDDSVKHPPPIPRSAKPPHRPARRWRRLTGFGSPADQTRGRHPLRVSQGSGSTCNHGRHFTRCLLTTATRRLSFPISPADIDTKTIDLRPLLAVGRRSDSAGCGSSSGWSPSLRNRYGSQIFGSQAAAE